MPHHTLTRLSNCLQCGCDMSKNGLIYCSHRCHIEHQRDNAESVILRLCTKYKNGPSGCMNWVGWLNPQGYGKLTIGSLADGSKRVVFAHRLAASIWLGFDLNSPLKVCHDCDNPRCINPDHLFIGTMADNIADRDAKGRASGPWKLADCDLRSLRADYQSGVDQHELAIRYGLCYGYVRCLVHRRRRQHVM